MDIIWRATEFEPGEQLRARTLQKVSRLARYLPDLERADIELSLEPTRGVEARRIAQLNLILNGEVIVRVERRAAESQAALDAAVDVAKEQLLQYKKKREDTRHHRLSRREAERLPEEEVVEEEEEELGPV